MDAPRNAPDGPQRADGPMPDGPQHPDILQNQNPNVLVESYTLAVGFLQQYGWFLLGAIVIVYYLKTKFSPRLEQYRRKREEQNYLNVEPEVARQRLERMDATRRRLQEEHDSKAARFAEEQKVRDEEKRKAKLEDWERHQKGLGYPSKYKPNETAAAAGKPTEPKPKKNVYRNTDYMPLGGGGGSSDSCSWRPARKGGAGGG